MLPSIAWRREAWKEEAPDDVPSKDETAIVSQTNIGTVSKATLGKLLTDGPVERIIMGFSERIDTILN